MTLQEILTSALDLALLTAPDPDTSPLTKKILEIESAVDICLHQLAVIVRGKPALRARLVKEYSVALTSGIGTIPDGLLIEFMGEGIVRDADAGANNGFGNILQRVHNRMDFINYLDLNFGYYFIEGDTSGLSKIHTRQISSGSFVDTLGNLTINAPHAPGKGDLDTEVSPEISDTLIQLLRDWLVGAMQQEAAA